MQEIDYSSQPAELQIHVIPSQAALMASLEHSAKAGETAAQL